MCLQKGKRGNTCWEFLMKRRWWYPSLSFIRVHCCPTVLLPWRGGSGGGDALQEGVQLLEGEGVVQGLQGPDGGGPRLRHCATVQDIGTPQYFHYRKKATGHITIQTCLWHSLKTTKQQEGTLILSTWRNSPAKRCQIRPYSFKCF